MTLTIKEAAAKVRDLVRRRNKLIKEILELEVWEMQVGSKTEYRTRHAKTANRYAQLARIENQIRRIKNWARG